MVGQRFEILCQRRHVYLWMAEQIGWQDRFILQRATEQVEAGFR